MKFIDSVRIKIKSGDGGPGAVSFKSASKVPKMGCDGGDGGRGGSVYLVGDKNTDSLEKLRFGQVYSAEHGGKGANNLSTGADGKDLLIAVPLGTMVTDAETDQFLGEVLDHGERLLLARGGKRGYGNAHFVRSNHQAPDEHLPGERGMEKSIKLELKVIADVGLAGLPNAGKSSLLASLSGANPRIGAYPFTTLTPNLAEVYVGESWEARYRVADIPGLVDGASEGKGLGHRFLRHLERTKALAYVIDAYSIVEESSEEDCPESWKTFELLRREVAQFSSELLNKPFVVVLNKLDLKEEESVDQTEFFNSKGVDAISISSIDGTNAGDLKQMLLEKIEEAQRRSSISAPKLATVVESRYDGYTFLESDQNL
ncbi:MAG: GTPase ObgE [Oligoflexales bacterium]